MASPFHQSGLFSSRRARQVGLAIGALACAVAGFAPSVQAQTTTTTPVKASASGPTVQLGNTALGEVLVDASGLTLYMFTVDAPIRPSSGCYGACATAWPPLYVTGLPTAGPGVRASLLGRSLREDGKLIVTYAGWPLYNWQFDNKPGDILGQGVGRVWYVVRADGSIVPTPRPV